MGSEIRLTAEWVAAAMTGRIVGGDGRVSLAGVSIDTRSLRAGQLYVGIRGDRFDGADFAGAAAAAGAAGLVVPRGRGAALVSGGQAATATVIEVADTSLAEDRKLAKIYGGSGILSYWIVNLVDDCLEVYRGPRPDGTYWEERVLRRGESTDIAALPGVVVAVDEIL